MNQIKSRIWDGYNMILPRDGAYYQHYVSLCGGIVQKSSEGMDCFGGGDRWSRLNSVDKLEFMLFIGLQDNHDVDFYVGDIGEFTNGDRFIVKIEDWLEVYIDWIGEPEFEDQARDLYRIGNAKIIGNIHQHSELIKL
jgi:hypothetical protein